MACKLPDGFTVSDRVKEWSYKKYGYYDLPSQFISDFRGHFAAKGTKYEDWDRAFMNWIDWSSPAGRFYNADVWENALNKCKAIMNAEKPKVQVFEIKKPPPARNLEHGMQALKQLKEIINAVKP